jgi:hypothetical protein
MRDHVLEIEAQRLVDARRRDDLRHGTILKIGLFLTCYPGEKMKKTFTAFVEYDDES